MDYTPLQNSSEDSGCVMTNTEISTSSILHYTETPTTIFHTSRKRKFSHDNYQRKYSQEVRTFHSYESAFTLETASSKNFLSSTLNESLSKSLEKCNLGYTPNFYVERSPSESSQKRYKLDDSPKFQPKTRSAPSTPTKHLEDEELHSTDKSRSEPLTACYFTPDTFKVDKLGTQEKFALLYPSIQRTISPTKLKTPEKLREFLKKVNSPAKKRLFEHLQERQTTDPIVLFTVKNDFRHIVSSIFQYLSELDLCSVNKVSKSWRRALHSDGKAFPRYYSYSQDHNSNKENIRLPSYNFGEPAVPPLSPEGDRFRRCTKIVSRLSPSQSLHKCLRCMEPAVIQKNISQCQNPNCEYIYCKNCSSFSLTGPENFVDKCHMSELLLTSTKSSSSSSCSLSRSGLYDISNGSMYTPPSFLMNDSLSVPQTKYDSSGYISEFDVTPNVKRNLSLNLESQPLQPVSINKVENVSRRKIRRSSLVSVISARNTSKILEVIEPSSPPKVKNIAGSKQSKKNLKRLQF